MFLSARLVTRYADKYEPHLASAFQKLEEGAARRAPRARRADARRPRSRRRVDPAFNRHVEDLTRAWAERRVVRFRYRRRATTAPSASRAAPRSGRTCSSRRWRPTRCT